MKIIVIGNGFIGKIVARHYGCDLYKKRIESFADAKKATEKYDCIINCAGYADVDGCQENVLKAKRSNEDLPNWLNATNKRIIHISTGCLIDGFLTPERIISNESIYACTKSRGENPYNTNIRIRLPYSEKEHKKDLFTKILKMRFLHNELNSYTSIEGFLSDLDYLLINPRIGIFHSVHDHSTPKLIGQMLGHSFKDIEFDSIKSKVKRVNTIMLNNIQPVDKKFRIKETIERRFHG